MMSQWKMELPYGRIRSLAISSFVHLLRRAHAPQCISVLACRGVRPRRRPGAGDPCSHRAAAGRLEQERPRRLPDGVLELAEGGLPVGGEPVRWLGGDAGS